MSRRTITASATLRSGIVQAWNAVGQDLLDAGTTSNGAAMQAVLDVGLATYGTPEALKEARALYKEHGFGAVCTALAKQIPLL
jgi:hypothetical protein